MVQKRVIREGLEYPEKEKTIKRWKKVQWAFEKSQRTATLRHLRKASRMKRQNTVQIEPTIMRQKTTKGDFY